MIKTFKFKSVKSFNKFLHQFKYKQESIDLVKHYGTRFEEIKNFTVDFNNDNWELDIYTSELPKLTLKVSSIKR